MSDRSRVHVDRDAFRAVWLIVGLASALAMVAVAPAAAAENYTYKCWGIIATDQLQQTGLADLVFAELSREQGIELVEREQLDAAVKELELSALLGSDAAGRLKLGRLLKADALVLLSLVKPRKFETQKEQEQQFLKLVVSDCVYGARLRIDRLPYDPDEIEQVAKQCASLVRQTRQHFAAGIKQIVGVTHFVSKNLTHDYDNLQAGYTYLLENALLSFPGVAVIETEEAQAIGRELSLAGGGPAKRVMPLFVEGEFEMTREKPGVEPTVHLTLHFTDGRHTGQKSERSGLSFSQVTAFLSQKLPLWLVRRAQQNPGAELSGDQQRKLLVARADLFSQWGNWNVAIGLREAALLLDPKNTPQRIAVIAEYARLISAESRQYDLVPAYHTKKRLEEVVKKNVETWEKLRAEHISRWRIILGHIEDVIRRRAVNPREASRLVSAGMSGAGCLRPYNQDASQEVKKAAREFFWRVYPLFPKLQYGQGTLRTSVKRCVAIRALEPGAASKALTAKQQYSKWTGEAVGRIVNQRTLFFYASREDPRMLDDLHRFLTELTSQEMPPIYGVGLVFVGEYNKLNKMVREGRFTADQIRQFCERLKQTNQPLNVFYGRCGLVSLKLCHKAGETPNAEAIREVNALLKFLEGRGYKEQRVPGRAKPVVNSSYNSLCNVRRKITEKLRKPPDGKPTKALAKKCRPFHPSSIRPIDLSPRVVFEPVDEVKANWIDLLKCTESLDVMWSWETAYAMAKRGHVKKIFAVEKKTDSIQMVVWDGEHVWISTIESGVWIVSPEGRILGHVGTEEGLPPYNKVLIDRHKAQEYYPHYYALLLHPIEPGKCIAIGTTGKYGRVWFAALSHTQDASKRASYSAKVFFTATKLALRRVDPADTNLEIIFRKAWIMEYSSPKEPLRRLLLVGRRGRSGDYEGRRPLAIDLKTLDVSVFPGKLPSSARLEQGGREFCCVRGRILFSGKVSHKSGRPVGIRLFSPPDDEKTGDWTSTLLVEMNQRGLLMTRRLFPHEGMVYHPGHQWYRVDQQNLQCERLTKGPLSRYHWYTNYGVSAHYGLVAWNNPFTLNLPSGRLNKKGRLFRVAIDPAGPPDPAVLYPRVPEQYRQKHHQAVLAISKLGGVVGEIELGWNMAGVGVILTQQWKGADEGLAHLKDLHNLNALFLVRTPVTNQGLRHIGRIEQLRSLYLVETKITDDGLVHLGGLQFLSRLRLEGTLRDNKFSDDGLKHLRDLPRIERLDLWGPRFTEKAITYLRDIPRLQRLHAYDTGITKAALSDFKKIKPIRFLVAP